jgi:hypothetical protein
VRGNNAGLGVPRGVRNLESLNRRVESKGSATLSPRSVPRAMAPMPNAAGRPAEMGGRDRMTAPARGARTDSTAATRTTNSAPRTGGGMGAGRPSSGAGMGAGRSSSGGSAPRSSGTTPHR